MMFLYILCYPTQINASGGKRGVIISTEDNIPMLTELGCKALLINAKKLKKPLKKSDGKGLLFHAFPNGSGYWYHKYNFKGEPRQLSYGSYPLIALVEARVRHAENYLLIRKGIDPWQLMQEEIAKAKLEQKPPFKDVACEWHRRNLKLWSTPHAQNVLRRLQKNLFPDLGDIPIDQVTRKQLLTAIRKVDARNPDEARKTVQYAIKIFTYALDEELVQVNIALGMEKSLAPRTQNHYKSMSTDALPDFLKDLDNNTAGLSNDRKDAIELLMLTVVRPNELVKAEWSEFDLDKSLWIIPARRMKMRSDHIVPLSRQAKFLLNRRLLANNSDSNPYPKSKYVFPSRWKPRQPMAHNTICDIVIDMGYKGKHTGHGFRALFMGIAKEKLKYRHEVPDRQLAHMPRGSVNRSYDRALFLEERTELMQRYANFIDDLRKPVHRWGFKLQRLKQQFQYQQSDYNITIVA